ncbi:MAG: hypothetical protein JEZ06_01475 [Anaerolineaceae bacterium]|nr:hypothetical protein [Anaerolineaceae bacterium]
MSIQYTISSEIFDKFPNYCRGVVVAQNINNSHSSTELVASLRAAESELRTQLDPKDLLDTPQIASWRDSYSQLGFKPGKNRPSMEALIRRILKNNPLPSINKVVDLGNLVSIQNLVPVGAHAIDVVSEDLMLRLATGKEIFEAFGSDVVEKPNPSESVFAEGNTVLTRRWTWRQAKHTLVVPETTAIEINVDGLPPVTIQDIKQICGEVVDLVQKYCGGEVNFNILTRNNPAIHL